MLVLKPDVLAVELADLDDFGVFIADAELIASELVSGPIFGDADDHWVDKEDSLA